MQQPNFLKMKKTLPLILAIATVVVTSCSSPAEMTEGNTVVADTAAVPSAPADTMNMHDHGMSPGAPDSAKGH
jgi:hypothetical protein